MNKTEQSEAKRNEKKHDSIMNTLDWSLENATGLDWLEFSDTKQYKAISRAVWEIAHGQLDKDDD